MAFSQTMVDNKLTVVSTVTAEGAGHANDTIVDVATSVVNVGYLAGGIAKYEGKQLFLHNTADDSIKEYKAAGSAAIDPWMPVDRGAEVVPS